MISRPLRLAPGSDLREALESHVAKEGVQAFVVCGIGSLVDARLRLAAQETATVVPGPSEVVSLAGSLSTGGAHLHMAIATADGTVIGGHVLHGCAVRTTAEVLLALLPEWQLGRAPDPATGHAELVVRPRTPDA